MTIYSTLLWQGEMPTTTETIYTVPAGQTAVIRDVEYFNATSSSGPAQVQTTDSGFGVAVACRVNSVPGPGGAQWQGRVVLNPGTTLQIAAVAAGWYICISGYVFTA